MKKITTGLSILFFLFILAYVLAFAVNNSQPLALDFLVGVPVTLPVALWLGAALLAGASVGLGAGIVVQTKQKLRIRRLQKELQNSARVNKLS